MHGQNRIPLPLPHFSQYNSNMERQIKRRLSEFFDDRIAAAAGVLERRGESNPFVSSLEYDSRNVKQGTMFFALPGLHSDGHRFIQAAVKNGAVAVVHQAEITDREPEVVYIRVKSSRFAMSPLAASFYGFPSRRLLVAGVTGTEGKSTSVYLIWQLLRFMGLPAGFFSTVQTSDGGEAVSNSEHQTTPEATVVQRLLWQMAENGCAYAVVESSSHALSPRNNRLGDVHYDAAVFTNIGQEHLEFHGTQEQYRNDKANLFRALDRRQVKKGIAGSSPVPEPFGVVNMDDRSAGYFTEATKRKTVGFSTSGMDAELTLAAIESDLRGNWYSVLCGSEGKRLDIRDRLPGAFNAGNVLAALLTVSGLTGVPVADIAGFCPKLLPVPGRMSAVDRGQNFEVLVDYAHTPSSFRAVFPPLRERLDASGGKIIALFGSAGERDTAKRQEQGKIAAAFADIIILSDEDPRGEQPMDIIDEIARGIFAQPQPRTDFRKGENLFLIPDRPAAIRKAISLAAPGDAVLLLGKGHENNIIYADRVMPFDEIREAEKALEE